MSRSEAIKCADQCYAMKSANWQYYTDVNKTRNNDRNSLLRINYERYRNQLIDQIYNLAGQGRSDGLIFFPRKHFEQFDWISPSCLLRHHLITLEKTPEWSGLQFKVKNMNKIKFEDDLYRLKVYIHL